MSSEPLEPNQDVIIPRSRDSLGRPVYKAQLTRTDNQSEKVALVRQTAPLPVIFIPGIMGTNLRNKADKSKVWRPPNGLWPMDDLFASIGALWTWYWRDAKARQRLLKAERVEVDDQGTIDVGQSGLSEEAARLRGWGKVMRSAYNPVMGLMERRLDNIVSRRELQAWWNDEALSPPGDQGEEQGKVAPIDEEELLKASRYQFDVWCAGYNWLQSNRQSALDVRDYIENTVLPFYQKEYGLDPGQVSRMKVILVTHSMGGLVARALTQLHGYERVLGVVHGVQPATGSSTIYHHMRCGYEGIAQVVLGRNAGEVTAVVANSAGALELAPSAEYREGRPWLFLCDAQGQVLKDIDGKPRAYPQNQDPYEEIYKADDSRHSWRDLIWKGDPTPLETPGATLNDDENGTYNSWFRRGLPTIVQGPLETGNPLDASGSGGDETVPTDSGQAPALAGVKASFRHGSKGKGQANTKRGYEHQESYNDARAQWAALYGVIKITQLADWHPNDKGGT